MGQPLPVRRHEDPVAGSMNARDLEPALPMLRQMLDDPDFRPSQEDAPEDLRAAFKAALIAALRKRQEQVDEPFGGRFGYLPGSRSAETADPLDDNPEQIAHPVQARIDRIASELLADICLW